MNDAKRQNNKIDVITLAHSSFKKIITNKIKETTPLRIIIELYVPFKNGFFMYEGGWRHGLFPRSYEWDKWGRPGRVVQEKGACFRRAGVYCFRRRIHAPLPLSRLLAAPRLIIISYLPLPLKGVGL